MNLVHLPEWTFDRKRISANFNPTQTLTLKHKNVIFRASVQIPKIYGYNQHQPIHHTVY